MDPAPSEAHRPFVPDTSIFVNPEVRGAFGVSLLEAVETFLLGTRQLGVDCYMPPSVFGELAGFLKDETASSALIGTIIQKAPSLDLRLPATVLRSWVKETRARVDRGLRLAEKAVRSISRGESEEAVVRRLRNEYRRALREGAMDSTADLELVLLALEIEGILISADAGLRALAEKLGVRMLDPEQAAACIKAGAQHRQTLPEHQ